MKDLSVEQRRTLTVVSALTLQHGRSPTLLEIAKLLRCSHSTARERVRWLEEAGIWQFARWTRKRQTLAAVAALTLQLGRSPTLKELAAALGCSAPAAHYRLHYLHKRGLYDASRRALTERGLAVMRSASSPD